MKNYKPVMVVVISLAISLYLPSCKKPMENNLPGQPVPIDLTGKQVSLIESGNTFAFDIFRQVLQNEAGNVIISPLSISYALSMTVNGANASTRDSMFKALRVKNITIDELNNSFSNLTDALLSVDKRVLISIANSVWTEQSFSVKKTFTDILTNYYNAESRSFNINDASAPAKINKWIEDNTNGLIKNMIDKLNDNTVMLLINAIYFKGKWKIQFDNSATTTRLFNKPDGSSSNAPFMHQKETYKVYQGNGFVLAEIPYGQGNFVMDIILPDNNSIDIASMLTGNNLQNWINNLSDRKVNLYLPRFKYGYKKKLKDPLSLMGMRIAFTDAADFTNITTYPPLLINEVTHQAFIETNEDGTEAAAATVVEVGVTSIGPDSPLLIDINHPFIYFIRETTSNSIIFMGKVSDPLSN
jgi:serine protease inhibitor